MPAKGKGFMRRVSVAGGDRPRVVVVGAGVIGLGIGWRLALAGCRVEVLDKGLAGRASSWAAGGMLAGGVEIEPGEEVVWPLAAHSQRLWPAFRDALQAGTGVDIGYRDEGTMVIALTRDDVGQMRFHYELQRGLGVDLTWLSGAEVRAREPCLHAGVPAGVYSPLDHQVDSRALVAALTAGLLAAGGVLRENCEVTAIDITGDTGAGAGHVTGVQAADGASHPADVVVVAAGAWSRGLPGLPEVARPPVRPLRGQLLVLRMDPAEPLLRHVVWAPRAYLIPRKDGRLLIGATTEERGFDVQVTAGGVYGLLDGAWRALPGIEELPLLETVAGLRPGSRDDAPIVGPTAVDGLVLATGHHRNGILLAPVTVEAVSRWVLDGELMDVIRPFALDRFQSPRPAGPVTP
jgi:glycine oxidase